jgi:hypothetical protein
MSRSFSLTSLGCAGGLIGVLAAGCSFIDSSQSISKSIGSSFESSSSSSPGSSESAYREDVRDYTYANVRSIDDGPSFLRGLGPIAQKHGVSNWAADSTTWVGIGEGLAKAKVSAVELETAKQQLAGTDVAHKAQIQQGFDGYRQA